MQGRAEADFSLSGLKTALRLEAEKIAPLSDQDVADLCASFQQAVVDVVADRLRTGLAIFRDEIQDADRDRRRRRRRRQSGDPAKSCIVWRSKAARFLSCRRLRSAPTMAR